MRKQIVLFLFTAFLLQMFGCIGKKEDTFINGTSSLEILSGTNQTAIIGDFLPQTIKVKISKDGQGYQYAFAMFQFANCNGTSLTKVPVDRNGIAEFTWRLGDKIGEQTITVYAYIDNIPVETKTIKATALDYDKNKLNIAACLDLVVNSDFNMVTADNKNVWAFRDSYLNQIYFSKNSGRSWQIMTDFFVKPQQFKALKNGDIYWISNDTLFSSKDFGKTRQFKKVPELNQFYFPPNLHVTNFGTILVSGTDRNAQTLFYLSTNAGTSWFKPSGLDAIGKLEEAANGRLFCTGYIQTTTGTNFFVSDDKGKNWAPVWSTIGNNNYKLSFADQIYTTSKNEIYVFSSSYNYVIYKTADFGRTWTYIAPIYTSFYNLQEYNNEFYYLESSSIHKTANFVDKPFVLMPSDKLYCRSFFISPDNFFIFSLKENVYYKAF